MTPIASDKQKLEGAASPEALPRAKPLIADGYNFIKLLAPRGVEMATELSGTESGRSAWLVVA